MAAPRLRHAFRYPDSDSDADLPSAIDEQGTPYAPVPIGS
jgi:hypothetical protein